MKCPEIFYLPHFRNRAAFINTQFECQSINLHCHYRITILYGIRVESM